MRLNRRGRELLRARGMLDVRIAVIQRYPRNPHPFPRAEALRFRTRLLLR